MWGLYNSFWIHHSSFKGFHCFWVHEYKSHKKSRLSYSYCSSCSFPLRCSNISNNNPTVFITWPSARPCILWYCFNVLFSNDQLIFTVSDSGSGKSSSLPCLQKHFFHFSIKAQSHNISQMVRSSNIYWQFIGKIQPLVNEGAQVGEDGENIGRVTNPLLPPNLHLRASQYADLINLARLNADFSFFDFQRSSLVKKNEKKNEKKSPSWGGQGGGLPLLEPGQLGPALNNNLCCKIEEIIYETRVQYSKRNLPQTPHDEAWKEGM